MSAGTITPLDAAKALQLIETLDCAVNLLPEFRAAAISQFSGAAKGTQSLLSLTEPNASNPSGLILYMCGGPPLEPAITMWRTPSQPSQLTRVLRGFLRSAESRRGGGTRRTSCASSFA